MSMKIDGNRPFPDADPLRGVESGARKTERAGAQKPAETTDRVEVSADARRAQDIVANALDAAAKTPDVRADVVERAKALRESGQLGSDAGALADALIDDLLKQP
jgi:flagellar biosynthesis anti-sigma factor FlgM